MMHAYALKMWGKVSGDYSLEARYESHLSIRQIKLLIINRSNLQLAIISRSLQYYYLYQQDNTVQPKEFIGNKVAGILFENKVDHTTFFSPDIEAIQGIHMIPILASTPYVRVPEFVREEWSTFFSDGRIDEIRNAWKGIIFASYATVEPKLAWDFFSSRNFDPQWVDGGASLTWFLALAAGVFSS
jgi:endo-1,3(4)-beta-glucanase